MTIKSQLFIFLCFFGILLYGSQEALAESVKAPHMEVIIENLYSPTAVVVRKHKTYLIAHQNEKGEGIVSKLTKNTFEPLLKGLVAPKGLALDPRKTRLYVADKREIKIFSLKKPSNEPIVIPISTQSELVHIGFSIINRRAYVVDSDGAIWSVSPKQKTTEILFSSEYFRDLNLGTPMRVLPSNDGARLYVVTNSHKDEKSETKSEVLAINIRKRKVRVLKRISDFARPTGIDIYKGNLVIVDYPFGHVLTLGVQDYQIRLPTLPSDISLSPVGFAMDLHFIVLLDVSKGESKGRLVRFPLRATRS